MLIDSETCILDILEAMNSPFTAARDLYLKNGEGFLCVFAVDSIESFEDIESHGEDILLLPFHLLPFRLLITAWCHFAYPCKM